MTNAIRIKTPSGWQDLAVQGAQGIQGVQGPQGATGATGPVGPSTGPAGGDLAGSYPNPSVVKSAGDFTVAGRLLIPTAGALAGLLLGGDANLYRYAANVLATDALLGAGYSQNFPTRAVGLKVGYNGGWASYLQAGVNNAGDTWLGHNAYVLYNGANLLDTRWNASHASFGSRGIALSFAQGIRFFADVAAATADSPFTPTERLRIGNDGKLDVYAATALATALTLGNDAKLYRYAANVLRTEGKLLVGAYTPLSSALIAAVGAGNGLEFGHNNPAGYRSTLGSEIGTGKPFLAFNAEHGSAVNTYMTRGIAGAVIQSDNAGGLIFGRVPLINADSQSLVALMALSSAGVLTLGGVAVALTNDARLSDARTPTAHKATHEPGGSDPMAVDAAPTVGSLRTLGTGANQAVAGNDARLAAAPATFATGSGAPTAGVGADGGVYLDYVSGRFYGPKAAGAWPSTPLGVLVQDATTYDRLSKGQ